MQFIENTTPYIGRIYLTFEKDPWYEGQTKLNKVHLNLGFTKLVSRIKPNNLKDGGWEVDQKKVAMIERYTRGVIGTHTFSDGEFQLPNSFLASDGTYIGDICRGWWYLENDFEVCEEKPLGVAKITDRRGRVIGYHGYSHRGGNSFKIGDRLFDAKYKPVEADYEEWEWAGYEQKYREHWFKGDDLDRKWMEQDRIACIIPYAKRGKKEIKTIEEALQAAINLSKDLG